MLVVLDTNIFISAVITPSSGYPVRILDLFDQNHIRIASSEILLGELQRTLTYPKIQKIHDWTIQKINLYVEKLRSSVLITQEKQIVHVIRTDPSDNYILSCALEAQADFIVSGDKHLLTLGTFRNIPILTPHQFVNQLNYITSFS